MKIVTSFKSGDSQKQDRVVLTIGNFDGIHRGHKQLLDRVVNEARKSGSLSAVLTFQDHPQSVLSPESSPRVLSLWPQKMNLLERLGIDICFLLDFKEVRQLQPENFFKDFLFRYLKIQKLVLGFNFQFGYKRSGTIQNVERIAQNFDFQFETVPPVQIDDIVVSSTVIRRQIQDGNLHQAEKLLGHDFILEAPVVSGSGRGKTIGFPTANLGLTQQVLPPDGVWAVRVDILETDWKLKAPSFDFKERILHQNLKGALNIGRKPTFENQNRSAEVYILDWNENLVGKTLRVKFIKRIRDEKKFDSAESLKKQIQKDVEQIKLILK